MDLKRNLLELIRVMNEKGMSEKEFYKLFGDYVSFRASFDRKVLPKKMMEEKYRRVTNDSQNGQWIALNTDSVLGKKAHHNFLTDYSNGYRKYQFYTMSDISIEGDGLGNGITRPQTN